MGINAEAADNAGADNPLLAFIHVPKTGGTSLEGIWRANERSMFHIGEPRQATTFLQEQANHYGIFGHMPFGIDRHVDRPVTYITFLRHPVERVLSAYAHNLRHPDALGADIIRKRGIAWTAQPANFMCLFLANYGLLEQPDDEGLFWWNRSPPAFVPREYLEQAKANLDKCEFIGLTEHYEEDVRALGGLQHHNIHIPDTVPWEQTGNNRLQRSNLTGEQIEAVRAGNRLDLELYEYALGLRERWGGPIRKSTRSTPGGRPFENGFADIRQAKSSMAAESQPPTSQIGTDQPSVQRLTWTDRDLEWRALPDHSAVESLPHTFAIPAAAYDYGAATGLLRAAHCMLRVRAKVNSGNVGLVLTSADGAVRLSTDRVLTAQDGRVELYFKITPQMAPAILVVRNSDPEGAPGSVSIGKAQYAPWSAQWGDGPGVIRQQGLLKRIMGLKG